jgi:choline-sulfatase
LFDAVAGSPLLDPVVGPIPEAGQDPHSVRLMKASQHEDYDLTPEIVRRARQGYIANIAYVDEKIGGILDVLARTRMADDTIVVFVSDHGDMLGERGLWFKMNFFEPSARVPLSIALPGSAGGTVRTPVSTLDVMPTLCEIAGVPRTDFAPWCDGESLLPLLTGTGGRGPVPMEYAAEGSIAPLVALRDGRYKLAVCTADPPMLFDLEADPLERVNLADDPKHAGTLTRLATEVQRRWDLAAFDAEVRLSQARRRVVYEALRNGAYFPWDFQPLQKASERYMRNHMDLNVLEENQRFPRGE